jgi:hypothetical protein
VGCLGNSLPERMLSRLTPTNVGTLCAFLPKEEKEGQVKLDALFITLFLFVVLVSPPS